MPSRSAVRGPSIATGAPSTSIVPPSAGCAPARIFISVDLPAPFSPTSACTSPASTSNVTPSSARTPGNDLTMSRIRSSGAAPGVLLSGVCLRVGTDGDGDLRRRRLPAEVVVDRVDRLRADLRRVLDRVAVHHALRDRGTRLGRCVVADDGDLALQPRGLDRLRGAERGVVVDPEHALEVLVRLQDVV